VPILRGLFQHQGLTLDFDVWSHPSSTGQGRMTAMILASCSDEYSAWQSDLLSPPNMASDCGSANTSVMLLTPPADNPASIALPGLNKSTCKGTTSLPTTPSIITGSSRPKLSHCTSSYRELAAKDPLREEGKGGIPTTNDGATPISALTVYEEFYRDLAAKPSSDFLKVLQEGPPPHLTTPQRQHYNDASAKDDNGKQSTRDVGHRASIGASLARTQSQDGENASRPRLTVLPKLFKIRIPSWKVGELVGKAVPSPLSARHRESSGGMKIPSGLGMGSISDYPQTTADKVRESVKIKSTRSTMDRTPWRHQRTLFGSTTTAEDDKKRETESIRGWVVSRRRPCETERS
jgi:hypothetical protein